MKGMIGMNNTSLMNDIFESIDNVDMITLESEMNVINAINECCTKSLMIMENYQGNDYECFAIFQEDGIDIKTSVNTKFRKIINSINRLIKKISLKLLNFKLDRVVKHLESIPKGSSLKLKNFVFNAKSSTVVSNAGGYVFEKLQDYINNIGKFGKMFDDHDINDIISECKRHKKLLKDVDFYDREKTNVMIVPVDTVLNFYINIKRDFDTAKPIIMTIMSKLDRDALYNNDDVDENSSKLTDESIVKNERLGIALTDTFLAYVNTLYNSQKTIAYATTQTPDYVENNKHDDEKKTN